MISLKNYFRKKPATDGKPALTKIHEGVADSLRRRNDQDPVKAKVKAVRFDKKMTTMASETPHGICFNSNVTNRLSQWKRRRKQQEEEIQAVLR